MQRIVVKNFLGIQEVDIKIGKVLVLIGEQASGKSTLAKLIYFFQTIQGDIFDISFTNNGKEAFRSGYDLEKFIADKFYNLFGSTQFWDAFEVSYSYGDNKTIALSISDNNKALQVQITSYLTEAVLQVYKNILKDTSSNFSQLLKTPINQALSDINKRHYLLVQVFELQQARSLYTIAGRNATVSYSDLFEKYLFSSLERSIKEQRAAKHPAKKQNTDEIFMLEFVKHVESIKEKLSSPKAMQEIINSREENEHLVLANEKIERILKGKYVQDAMGERIKLHGQNNKYVLLKNASSGQQEAIRILQDLFLLIAEERTEMRVFEEPEANLFPIAQKEMIELMALMLNVVPDSSIIITTHSPYILSVINNLLFAGQVAAKSPEKKAAVQELIHEKIWLQPEDVNAYSLGNSYDPDKNYFEDIFNATTGTIDQNYLDAVSEMLGEEFYQLIDINNQ
ncbi:MAG: AAA family ATPase [Aureispira sp.]